MSDQVNPQITDAVNQQQQASVLSQAVTTQCATSILNTKDVGSK